MTVTTVRPNATVSAGGYVATGAATLHAATSDDSDASYIARTAGGTCTLGFASLATAGAGVHLARMRFRHIAASDSPIALVSWYTGVGAGFTFEGYQATVAGAAAVTTASPWTVPAGVAYDAATVYANTLHATNVNVLGRYLELYIDWDLRARPTFTPDVQDGAGVSKAGGTITNTNSASLVFGTIDNDSLVARTWQVTIEDTGTSTIVYTASGTGTPPATVTSTPLPNGNYEAHFQSSSTIQTNTQWDSLVYDVTFAVALTPPAAPASVTATLECIAGVPSVGISWVDPNTGTAWDTKANVVAEVQRTDCDGTVTIAVIEHAIAGSWCDRFMTFDRADPCESPGCDDSTVYEVRYWGLLGGIVVSTAWAAAVGVDVVNTSPGSDWIRGPITGDMAICPDITWGRVRPFSAEQPIGGGYPVVNTGLPGGRNYQLVIATATQQALLDLEAILGNSMVHYTPADPLQPAGWFAPSGEGVGRPKVTNVHSTTVTLTQVEPEPLPNPADLL